MPLRWTLLQETGIEQGKYWLNVVILSVGSRGRSVAMKQRSPPLSKAELRAAAERAVAQAKKPIVKLPTKLTRQCGRCGEFASVMVEPGEEAPEFKCKVCDRSLK